MLTILHLYLFILCLPGQERDQVGHDEMAQVQGRQAGMGMMMCQWNKGPCLRTGIKFRYCQLANLLLSQRDC